MYRYLALLALLFSLSYASKPCLHNLCTHAFQSCNNTGHPTQECWDWSDEVFHCCDECDNCKVPKERECHDKICNTVYDVCSRIHGNNSDCWERADEATNCCWSCMDCPSQQPVPETKHECHPKICNAVFDVCSKVHGNDTSCQEKADEASNCCWSCMDCPSQKPKDSLPIQPVQSTDEHEHECHERMCNAIFDVCEHVHKNTSDCQEKADERSNCCYNCMDCPAKPQSDQCFDNLCNAINKACIEKGDDPQKCQEVADDASHCCNDCSTCNLEHHKKQHHKKQHKKGECEPFACQKSFDVCRSWSHEHKECRALADSTFNCCNHCKNCD